MQTIANILTSARAYIATLAPSRDATLLFKEHLTNQPFEKAPVSITDGFEITQEEFKLTQEFGVAGAVRAEFIMLLKLGHTDSAPDKLRELYVSRDISRLADLVEAYAFPEVVEPDAIDGVWFDRAVTNKVVPNWWITEMRFLVKYVGPVNT